jgi:hypothetical protein
MRVILPNSEFRRSYKARDKGEPACRESQHARDVIATSVVNRLAKPQAAASVQ